jgi:regulatory protein
MTNAKHGAERRRDGRRRGPREATPAYLERAALFYLERYAAPAQHLRRLLLAKVARSARVHGTDAEAGAVAVDQLIARLTRAGLLDDAAYAAARARSQARRGTSARGIRSRLLRKGVAPDLIDQALAGLAEAAGEPELAAALIFVRRRRLGPYRAADRADRRERDLAALGRQGFDLDLARRVIDARDLAELEDEAGLTPGRRIVLP